MPPSGPPGPGNLYRLRPRLVGTACSLYSLFNDVLESYEFHGRRSGTEVEFPHLLPANIHSTIVKHNLLPVNTTIILIIIVLVLIHN